MSRYEVLFLTVPEITTDETSKFQADFEKLLKEHKSSLLSFERWGKYFLAYPIRKNDYGVYFLARFEVSAEHKKALLDALEMFFAVKNVDLVMRHMVAVLDAEGSLEYQRPESLEEAPARDAEQPYFGKGKGGYKAKRSDAFVTEREEIEEIEV